MNYFDKLLELLQSRKFQIGVTSILTAYAAYSAVPKTPETTGVFIGVIAGVACTWIHAQGKVDAAKAANINSNQGPVIPPVQP